MINGETEIYGILADPVHHVSAPELMNKLFIERGDNKVLVPLYVDKNSLESVLQGLKGMKNFKGAVITMPHKVNIVEFLDNKTEDVIQVNACNVIKRTERGEIIGAMFDGKGFVKGLEKSNFEVEGKSAFLIGAGGAASGIAYSLCENKIKKLTIFNRTKNRAKVLIENLKSVYPNINIVFSDKVTSEIDILINGTSAGMKETDSLPISLEELNNNILVAEVIIRPEITKTLKEALDKGCKIHKGIYMLEGQLELMLDFMN